MTKTERTAEEIKADMYERDRLAQSLRQQAHPDPAQRIGVSAAERDVRRMLEVLGDDTKDTSGVMVKVGVLRGLLRDIDMWREIASNLEPRPAHKFTPSDEEAEGHNDGLDAARERE